MIDYNIIARSIPFYESAGFQRIESPWTVTPAISNITKPHGAKDMPITGKDKVLVASGEQSFLSMYNKGFLPKGRFQSVTPCFRDESFTPFHTKYFIKNELIITDVVDEKTLKFMIDTAVEFFTEIGLGVKVKSVSSVLPSYDIEFEGIELGSYGIRRCDFLYWIYGTGVAEPRLSKVMDKYGLSH